ncbi:6-carboxytetrahydropterin synthase QueD [Clostridium neuense]|uniref:6-carboxy-5,6,7,8-tetrahydropterin synthase n=1 Tax=Clostridium neuense TaxID=1728934 RepID=A0ABW8TK93_9CLOT
MYTLKIEHSFDSAHFLKDYNGKCSNIHGHRWKVEVEIQSPTLVSMGQLDGMVDDFGTLKENLRKMLDTYDHALIIEKHSLRELTFKCLTEDGFKIISVNFRPTAENFARFFFSKIKEFGYKVKKVTVYETPNNSAAYTED